ncbi:MAG: putative ATP-dependent helicase [Prokaryotic dsDNA virus sp.]|nr:MAG: putative ATP-dependent helicase [Prokaryotic dsDNA virus sp.]|tara:strand:- start:3462 stop:5180 length:1719 start_codon:yes stop_codon:yes gene_type:complete
MNYWEKLTELGFDINAIKDGQQKIKCPQCSDSRKKNRSEPCLSMRIDNSGAQWRCHHCHWTGNAWKQEKQEVHTRPAVHPKTNQSLRDSTKPLTDPMIDWFAKRGIHKDTLDRAGVRSGAAYLKGTKQTAIAFVHYNADSSVINIKYRGTDKTFSQEKGGERLPYLWNQVDTSKDRLIIVEGEVDALSLSEIGIDNVISVPDGASDKKLVWLDELHEDLDAFKQIVLFTDDDKAGLGLRDELARRLSAVRCWRVTLPSGCKDANDVLVKHGRDELMNVLESAQPFPLRALRETNEYVEDALRLLHGDIKQGVSTGIEALDFYYKVRAGELTLVSGAPGVGKSEFLDAFVVGMAKNEDWSFAICSFENPVDEHINKLVAKHVGKPAWQTRGNTQMTDQEWLNGVSFIGKHCYWIRAEDEAPTIEWCLNTATACVQRYPNVRGLVLDPYNEFEHKRPSGWTETEYVSQMMASVKRWAMQHGVHVWLVAHPAKLRRNPDGTYPTPEPYDIAGSANFYNKADNILIVERDFTPGSSDVRVHVKKIRFKHTGTVGMVELRYDYESGRYGLGMPVLKG